MWSAIVEAFSLGVNDRDQSFSAIEGVGAGCKRELTAEATLLSRFAAAAASAGTVLRLGLDVDCRGGRLAAAAAASTGAVQALALRGSFVLHDVLRFKLGLKMTNRVSVVRILVASARTDLYERADLLAVIASHGASNALLLGD